MAEENPKQTAKQQKSIQIGCLAIIIIISVIVLISYFFSGGSKSKPPEDINLSAKVAYNEGQFIISNLDSFDWNNVKIEINPGTLSSGYILKIQIIKAKTTYTVGSMQFAKPDGTKFNPFAIKPQKLVISADTPRGKGYYFGTWD